MARSASRMVVLGAVAGVVAGSVGTASSISSDAMSLLSAEQVAARFVVAFESYGATSPPPSSLQDLAAGQLATMLSTRPGSDSADALEAEGYGVRAVVEGMSLAGRTRSTVDLLVDTELTVTDSSGTTVSSTDVPVTLARTPHGWRVTEAGGIGASPAWPGHRAPAGPSSPAAGQGSSAAASPQAAGTRTDSAAGTPTPVGPVGDIPAQYVALFEAAPAAECPAMSWSVLAGIGKVESDFGRSTLPGVHSGANSAGAEGPMQFEPATFAEYAVVAPGGADPASPYDPADAVYSAAHLLCADGAGDPATLYDAIFDYNHSASYVQLVLAYAAAYTADAADGGSATTLTSATVPGDASRDTGLASVIIADAQAYLGTPYVWGGENPKVGFDCSGLVQWVFAEAGVHLPRVAQEQYDYGPVLPKGAALDPGDLVFFGGGPDDVEHVGIYVGDGEMIDAPYTGAVVRYDEVADVPLGFVGATRPEDPNVSSVADLPVVDDDVTDAGTVTDPAPVHPRPPSASADVPSGTVDWTPPVHQAPSTHHRMGPPTTTTTSAPPGSTTTSNPPGSTTTTDPGSLWTSHDPPSAPPTSLPSPPSTYRTGGAWTGVAPSVPRGTGAQWRSPEAGGHRGGGFSRPSGATGGGDFSFQGPSGRPGTAPGGW